MSKDTIFRYHWEELSEAERLIEFQNIMSMIQEKNKLEKNKSITKPETKLVAKIVCASGKGSRWYDNHVGEEFDIATNARSGYHDRVVVTTKPFDYSFYVYKCDCMVYEKEIESVKEQKKDNVNKTYFEKQVELYLKDLGGYSFPCFNVVSNLKSLMINHNNKFKSKIVEIQSSEGLGCPFKVFVKNMSEAQISFLQKLIRYSLPIEEIVEVVEFVEHPFSKNV